MFYDVFVNVNDDIPQNKWQAEIGDISENERKAYFLSIKKWHEVKLRDFQYNINNYILVTITFLAKIYKFGIGVFLLQGTTRKNTTCPKIKYIWRELKEWLNTNVNIEISLEDREILFYILVTVN